MNWFRKIFALNDEQWTKLKGNLKKNRVFLLFISLFLGFGSGIISSGLSYLYPDVDVMGERIENANIENLWNRESPTATFYSNSNLSNSSYSLKGIDYEDSIFDAGAFVNPSPISNNFVDNIVIPKRFETIKNGLPEYYSLKAGVLPSDDFDILISDRFASEIAEKGYSVDGIELEPGFDISNLVGQSLYLSKTAEFGCHVIDSFDLYVSAQLKPWFQNHGVKLKIAGIYNSTDSERYIDVVCTRGLLKQLEDKKFPISVSYFINTIWNQLPNSNGNFYTDAYKWMKINNINLISEDIPVVDMDFLSTLNSTYGAEKVWPGYVSYNVFRSLAYLPYSLIQDWNTIENYVIPDDINPTGKPISVTGSLDDVFGNEVQKLASYFTAYTCFDPNFDYSNLYNEDEEATLYFQSIGKNKPASLSEEQCRDVFSFWIAKSFTWLISAESDPVIGPIQKQFNKNIQNLLNYFSIKFYSYLEEKHQTNIDSFLPHLPIYSNDTVDSLISEFAIVGVVPNDYDEFAFVVNSQETYDSLGTGLLKSVTLKKENHENFVNESRKLLDLGFSISSDVLPNDELNHDISIANAMSIVLLSLGSAMILIGSTLFGSWYIFERRKANFHFKCLNIQSLSILSSGLIGLLIYVLSFFLLNLVFETGALYPLFLPTWVGFVVAIFAGIIIWGIICLIGLLVKSEIKQFY